MRQKFSLTSAEAHAMVTAAKLEAVKNNWKVTIAVVDEGGYLLHLERMDGAALTSPEIATLKARTAALSQSSYQVSRRRDQRTRGDAHVSRQAAGAGRSADCVPRRMRGRDRSVRRSIAGGRADRERRTGCPAIVISFPARSAAEYPWRASPWARSANRRECRSIPDRKLLWRCTRAFAPQAART